MAIKDGTNGTDILVGTAGIDTLRGLGSTDRLAGLAGADLLEGGDGNDTADYATAPQAVKASLLDGIGFAGDASGNRYVGIENLVGSAFADELEGDGGTNLLRGGQGGDTLFGGGGTDFADYATAQQGVKLSLLTGTGFGGEAFGDHYFSIENVTGSAFADELEGDGGDNLLSGGNGADTLFAGGGNDTLNGGGGNDRIFGGTGADEMNGGSGIDTLDYSFSAAGVTINLFGTLSGGDAQGDTISGLRTWSAPRTPTFSLATTAPTGCRAVPGTTRSMATTAMT